MNSKECIKATLSGIKKQRCGYFEIVSDNLKNKWYKQNLSRNISIEEYLDLDIFLFGFKYYDFINNKFSCIDRSILEINNNSYYGFLSKIYERVLDKDKYICLSIPGPFQFICQIYGYSLVFEKYSDNSGKINHIFRDVTDYIIQALEFINSLDLKFDGVWIWEDIAYNKGLYFSIESYKKSLSVLHKKLFKTISSLNKKIFFHSDGDINIILPFLVEYGIDAIHPLENRFHDLKKISLNYPNLVSIGNIEYNTFLNKKLDFNNYFSSKKYIYSCDSPLMDNINLANYKKLVNNFIRGKYEYKS